VNKSFSTTNGFSQWGLDADTQRQNPRQLLGYFRGGFINSSNLYDWGNDRRRLVVLNLVEGSASHSFREIVINTNSYTSSNDTAARAAINRILAASSGE
jgi:SLT domain-containing protein